VLVSVQPYGNPRLFNRRAQDYRASIASKDKQMKKVMIGLVAATGIALAGSGLARVTTTAMDTMASRVIAGITAMSIAGAGLASWRRGMAPARFAAAGKSY
jgi:hypothetical protein